MAERMTITLKSPRRGFAGARPDRRGLRGYLDLQRAVEDPRILSAARYTNRLLVHHFRVTEPAQLDDEFAGWVREAYAVGSGNISITVCERLTHVIPLGASMCTCPPG